MSEIGIQLGSPGFLKPDLKEGVRGGGTRYVPLVPVGNDGTVLPCIWKSHYTVQAELSDGSRVPANECLLLISRQPIATIRAEVAVSAWQHFETGPVEW